MAERDLSRRIQDELKRQCAYFVKISPPVERGTPDILACYRGVFLGLELKQPGKHRTRIQRYRAEQIEQAGGIAREIHTLEELLDVIRSVDARFGPH